MNLSALGEFASGFPTGAVSLSERLGQQVDWCKLDKFLKTEESVDDFAKFRDFAKDVYSSVILSVMCENEVDKPGFSADEEHLLQNYYFEAYLRTFNFILHDSDIAQIMRDGVLDSQKFYALYTPEVDGHLYSRISELQELDSIHRLYVYRKALAKCDFIKWGSDFDEIVEKLKYQNKWSELSDSCLNFYLQQHFSLLCELKNGENITGMVSNSNIPECSGNNVLEAVDKEYSERLANFAKELDQRRMRRYLKHMKFKNLVTKRIDQAEAFKTVYIPQAYQ